MGIRGFTSVFAAGTDQALSSAALDIVFVHGLSGGFETTWKAENGAFWPQWLADEFDSANVHLAGYDSGAFASFLLGSGASIQDLASILADGLISLPHPAKAIVLITHSLGGLIVKQMLRRCVESADSRFQNLAKKVRAVVFLGTPHQGASLAKTFDTILRPFKSRAAQQLAYSSDNLIDLNTFFSSFAVRERVVVRPFYETDKTQGIQIVDRVTANPNVHGAEPIAVQADHIKICKPESKQSLVYRSVCELLHSLLSPSRSLEVVTTPAINDTNSSSTTLLSSHSASECTYAHALATPGVPVSSSDDRVPDGITSDILEDFAYFTTVASDDRRSLAQKLRDADRGYQIGDATRRKERFAMVLHRHIAQPSAVTRYMQLLGAIESRFSRHVRRRISEGASLEQVDYAIQSEVLDPCAQQFSNPGAEISLALVDNALCYLAGNCHVSWDK
ncbi:hypothetical protein C0V97_14035 [Asaia sp. W19]|uniref:ABC-three component system protein n=1 Tax=unclassified Asaia TaxID=2685023 RepID=UPI001001F4D2|nr:ABC-three component system protein [Asaia sp. W19]RUT24844.1 hypothetical protein C0V97_14035 [Asaia sp. W19]